MARAAAANLTFLFTDLEASSRLWEEHPDAMTHALARHETLLREAVASHNGEVVKTTGDGLLAVFEEASDALTAAAAAQQAMAAEGWPDTGPLRVRIGIHTGHAEYRAGDYYGPVVNRAARLTACAHGGQVLCSRLTATLAADGLPQDAALADLGEHLLRDLTLPEHVYQLVASGLPQQFPPIRSASHVRGNLPPSSTSFIGRTEDVAGVAAALESTRVVCVTGVGGVGKTRLALEVAAGRQNLFEAGAWLCDLSAVTDPDNVSEVVGATLGVQSRPGVPIGSAIVDFLRSKNLLLVLDNCEHVLDGVATLCTALVAEAPRVRVLATSREGLGIAGERRYPLLPLDVEVRDRARSEAEQLFVERAEAAGRSLVANGDRESIREICRRLDGIPLAIELAAARVIAMSPREIAERLDERFRFLVGSKRHVSGRHPTLLAAVSWSVSLLDDTERRVFVRLGVFAGSFDLEAALAVAGDESIGRWEMTDALEGLAAKSMLNADEAGGTRSAGGSGTRYSMLETIRHYAREQLDGGTEGDHFRRLHAQYYATLAERAGPHLIGPDEAAWARRLAEDLDNLRAAMLWSTGTADEHEPGLRIIATLATEATMGRATRIGSWAEQVLELVGETSPGRRAGILGAAAWRAIDRGEFSRARALAQQGVDGAKEPDCIAPQLVHAGLAFVDAMEGLDDPLTTCQSLIEDLERRDSTNDMAGLASMRAMKASCMLIAGCPLDAVEHEALLGVSAALRSGSASIQTVAHMTLGNCYLIHNDPDRAMFHFETAISLVENGASDVVYSMCLRSAARAADSLGDLASGATFTRGSLLHADRTGDRRSAYEAMDEACVVLARAGMAEAALALGVHREASGWDFSAYAVHRNHALAEASDSLSSSGADTARSRGATLSYDAAVALAVASLDGIVKSNTRTAVA